MSKPNVKWNRPVQWRYGILVYTSKCGKFRIERRKWVLPTSHTSYILEFKDAKGKESAIDLDTLRDAKEYAEDCTPAEGYDLVQLPAVKP